MHSDELLNAQFRPTQYTYGYDQQEVDLFIDQAAATLKIYESQPHLAASFEAALGHPPVTAQLVNAVQFTPTTATLGYDQRDVDACLDRLAVAFDAHERAYLA